VPAEAVARTTTALAAVARHDAADDAGACGGPASILK
jgi:hypothetical protein